jgi:hypothetical protein
MRIILVVWQDPDPTEPASVVHWPLHQFSRASGSVLREKFEEFAHCLFTFRQSATPDYS